MILSDVAAMVAMGESETLELKKSTSELHDGMRSLCAMANHKGGSLVFGVSPSAKKPVEDRLSGQDVSDRTLEEIATEVRRFEPPLAPDLEQIPTRDGRRVIVLSVPSGGGPFVYDGRPYRRVGAATSIMPQDLYHRLLAERRHGTNRWEIQTAEGVTIGDLDTNEITITIEEAIRRGRLEDPGTREPSRILQGFSLMEEGRISNAAVALFAKERVLPVRYPQCLLRMARFKGTDKSEFLDNRQEFGNAFDLMKRAQRFMRDHLPVAGRIVPGVFERQDDPAYPPEALREALANAIIHRDYATGGGSISLAIYQDRLEITSVGPLPFGQQADALFDPHPSRPWNPLMAGVFYRRGIIESWGRGTLKIAELSQNAGLLRPEIIATSQEVTVRFLPLRYVAPTDTKYNLSDLQRRLLTVLAEKPDQKLPEIEQRLGGEVPRRTVQDNLKLLRDIGLVDVQGEKRWAMWRLK